MKSSKRSRAADDGAPRKDLQLCRQAHEALSESLASSGDDLLEDVWIEAVVPSPDASRLAVVVRAPTSVEPSRVMERLATRANSLRADVASAIVRKRAPTLTFEVWPIVSSDA